MTWCERLWQKNKTAGGRNWGSAITCVASFARSSPAGRDGSIFARTANLMQCALCQGPTSWAWWWCAFNGQHINHRSYEGIYMYIYLCQYIYIYICKHKSQCTYIYVNIYYRYVYMDNMTICSYISIDEDFDVHIFPQRGVAKMMWVVASWAPDGRNGIRGGRLRKLHHHWPIQPWQHFPPPLWERGKQPIFLQEKRKK